MIHQFFGLREQPFGVTPDPRYLYLGPGHREALASLFYGVEANRGFLALIANPGMGKTTLLFHLLEKFRHADRTAFMFQTQCNSREFMRFLLAELGIPSRENDLLGMHEQFNRYLLEQSSAGRRVIVVVDEAQNLDPSVMETVRLLSNFETPRAKLLQIILAGQPQLATKLARQCLSQLRQRIASFNGLNPLPPQEVASYIDHRLHVAGYEGPSFFTDNAKVLIAELSEGIPRNINSLCFGALSLACALQKKSIDAEIVQEVFGDLDLQKLLPHLKHARTSQSIPLVPPTVRVPAVRRKVVSLPRVVVSAEEKSSPADTVVPRIVQPVPDVSHEVGDIDRVIADADAREGEPTSTAQEVRTAKVSWLAFKVPFRSVLSQAAVFAVIALAVGNWTTKRSTPAIRVADPMPAQSSEDKRSSIADDKPMKSLPGASPIPSPAGTLQRGTQLIGGTGIESPAPAVVVTKVPPRDSTGVRSPASVGSERPKPAKKVMEQVDTPTEDPAELWQLVKEGSIPAEVKLASLYLGGSIVEQDCKQAHLLLIVASRKGSKAASGLLSNEYVERCHE